MAKGIKFRRNEKSNLLDVQEAEIVYAIDTDEWGLGLSDGSVSWRMHEIKPFTNNYLKGTHPPTPGQGFVGDYFSDTLNEIVYQKLESGWVEIIYPQDENSIPGVNEFIPLGSIPNFTDLTKVIINDASVNLPNGYSPVDDNEPTTKALVDEAFGRILYNDGSTHMDDGYVAGTDRKVLTKLDFGSSQNFKPVDVKPELGFLWNNGGIPSIWNGIFRVPHSVPSARLFTGMDETSVVVLYFKDAIWGLYIYNKQLNEIRNFDVTSNIGITYLEESSNLQLMGDFIFFGFVNNNLGNDGAIWIFSKTTGFVRTITNTEWGFAMKNAWYVYKENGEIRIFIACFEKLFIYDIDGNILHTVSQPGYNSHTASVANDKIFVGKQRNSDWFETLEVYDYSLNHLSTIPKPDEISSATDFAMGPIASNSSYVFINSVWFHSDHPLIILDHDGNFIETLGVNRTNSALYADEEHVFVPDFFTKKMKIYSAQSPFNLLHEIHDDVTGLSNGNFSFSVYDGELLTQAYKTYGDLVLFTKENLGT